jgi:hypothetical protein
MPLYILNRETLESVDGHRFSNTPHNSSLHRLVKTSRFVVSIVLSTTDDLLHVRSKDERVFKLSSIAPFDVTERRISLNNSRFDKIVQAEKVFLLAEAVQVPSAKWQSAKVFVDDVKECAC